MKKLTLTFILGVSFVFSGCASNPISFLSKNEHESLRVTVKDCINKKEVERKKKQKNGDKNKKSELDGFLDCMLGEVDKKNLKLRLYRGHAAIALLAVYGVYKLENETDKENRESDAAELLTKLETAENLHRKAFANINNPNSLDAQFSFVAKYRRVDAAFGVAKVAIKPFLRQSRGFFMNLIAAFGGSPSAIKGSLNSLRGIIKQALHVDAYGAAYRASIKKIIDKLGPNGTPTPNHWKNIDNHLLLPACEKLAIFAKAKHHCLPPEREKKLAGAGTPS